MCKLGARVRLCKGAYKEPPEITYTDRNTIREKFMIYAEQLITQTPYPGIATHDHALLNATKTFVRDEDLGPESFEFQMLYGIRRETQRKLRDEGYNVLVYLPYGKDWFPYLLRRVRERKENIWFVLKHLFTR